VTRLELISRVQNHTRDFNATAFRTNDIIAYINEGIERLQQLVPQLLGMVSLSVNGDVPILLPTPYHHLLALYAAARCFAQDTRSYQATTLMNEFEVKVDELLQKIQCGEVIIVDALGVAVVVTFTPEYIDLDAYYGEDETEDHFIDYVYV